MGLRRDDVELHVFPFSGDGVAGGVVFVGVEEVDELHQELKAKGGTVCLKSLYHSHQASAWCLNVNTKAENRFNGLSFFSRGNR